MACPTPRTPSPPSCPGLTPTLAHGRWSSIGERSTAAPNASGSSSGTAQRSGGPASKGAFLSRSPPRRCDRFAPMSPHQHSRPAFDRRPRSVGRDIRGLHPTAENIAAGRGKHQKEPMADRWQGDRWRTRSTPARPRCDAKSRASSKPRRAAARQATWQAAGSQLTTMTIGAADAGRVPREVARRPDKRDCVRRPSTATAGA